MSDPDPNGPRKVVVPGSAPASFGDDGSRFEGLVNPRDLGSASRSCLVIIVVLLIIGVLLCVFLVGSILM